jgi:hypothetical protein
MKGTRAAAQDFTEVLIPTQVLQVFEFLIKEIFDLLFFYGSNRNQLVECPVNNCLSGLKKGIGANNQFGNDPNKKKEQK